MTTASFVVVLFGAFTLVGGIIGWVKVKSKPSLIAGTVSGILLFISAMGMNDGMGIAYVFSLIVSAALGIRFTKNYMKTRRLMPDLITIALSVITILVVVLEMAKR